MNNAFISYSHAADGILARALQSGLEQFAKPWYKLRNLNVFQDNSSLSASPHLWTSIQQALANSEYFIYMASPQAAESKWVQKEIEWWLNNKSLDNFIIVITNGHLKWKDEKTAFALVEDSCLPQFLLDKFAGEPLYIDFRSLRTQKDLSLNNAAFKDQVLKIAAKLHNKEPKDLSGEAFSAHRRTIRLRNIAIGTLIVLFVLAAVAAWIANTKSSEAVSERNRAESNYLISEAQRQVGIDPTLAIRLAAAAMNKTPDTLLMDITDKIYRENAFYKTILSEEYGPDNDYNSFTWLETLPGSKSFVVGTKNNTVQMYNLEGKLLREWKGYKDKIAAIAVSPNGELLAIAAKDGTVELTTISGNGINEYTRDSSVESLSFSPDGNLLLLASNKRTRLLDLQLKLLHDYGDTGMMSASFSPDNKTILFTGWEFARLMDYEGRLRQEYKANGIRYARFFPDGKHIVAGFLDSTLQIWTKDGILVKTVQTNGEFDEVDFSPDGSMFVCCSGYGNLTLYDVNGDLVQELEGYQHPVRARFLQDGSVLTAGGGFLRWWVLDNLPVATFRHADFVMAVDFSPDGKKILTGSQDHAAKIWTPDGKLMNEIKVPYLDHIINAGFSSDGNTILIATYDYYALYALNGKLIRKVPGPRCEFALFQPRSTNVLLGLMDTTAKLYNDHGKLLQTFRHKSPLSCATFSPDGKLLLTATLNGFAYLWDMEGNIQQEFQDYKYIPCIAFARDGKSVATAGTNFIVTKWNLKGERLQEFKGHSRRINAITFSPDGKQLLSCSSDNTAKAWNMKGEIVKEIKELANITSLAISPDSKYLLTGSWNATAKLWNRPKSLADFLKGNTLNELTNEQKKYYHLQ